MEKEYGLVFTRVGLEKKQAAELNSNFINMEQFSIGDGIHADSDIQDIVNEKYRANINNMYTKDDVTKFDLIIPGDVGGFDIKEVALYDADGSCIMIGKVPSTYKVLETEGALKKVNLRVSTLSKNTEYITFANDDSQIYATYEFVAEHINDKNDPHKTMEKVSIELDKKTNVLDVKNNLVSSDIDKPLAASQGKILNEHINNINTILLSGDNTLDSVQELVNYITQNRSDLDALGISNISGLQNALNSKAAIHDHPYAPYNHHHDSLYLVKTGKAADSAKLNNLINSISSSANTIVQRDSNGKIKSTGSLFHNGTGMRGGSGQEAIIDAELLYVYRNLIYERLMTPKELEESGHIPQIIANVRGSDGFMYSEKGVTSITKNGTTFIMNFDKNFPDTNYKVMQGYIQAGQGTSLYIAYKSVSRLEYRLYYGGDNTVGSTNADHAISITR